jgi:hypothetical protein
VLAACGRISMLRVCVKGDLQAQPLGGLASALTDQALGRSRGGLSTKIHLACEQGPSRCRW